MNLSLSTRPWGKTPYDEDATLYTLDGGKYKFTVSDFGATLNELFVPDKSGRCVDVILGYRAAKQTNMIPRNLGVTVGRVANRIEKGRFTAGGKTFQLVQNDYESCLHGGIRGFSRRMFTADPHPEQGEIRLSYHSPDGEEGFPGNFDLTVIFKMDEPGVLSIRYDAVCDHETPINLTNHAFFNLFGADSGKSTDDLMISIDAECYAGSGKDRLPNGTLCPVRGTPMDLRSARRLGDVVHSDFPAIRRFGGVDHAFILTPREGSRTAATLYCPENGIHMECRTDLPAMQLYTRSPVKNRFLKYGDIPYAGLCFETEYCPNYLNYGYYPGDLFPAGKHFISETDYIFSVK